MKKTYFGILVIIIFLIVSVYFLYERNKEIKILLVGDMFFDRYIREVNYAKGGDFIFSCIGDFLKKADMVVGNLEGPITENASRSLKTEVGSPDNFIFTFPTVTAKLLAKNNIKIVNLGNNHIGNFGQAGVDTTKKFLNEAEVKYFGGLQGDEAVYRTKINGLKISFVSYNEFGGEAPEIVAQKIKEEKDNKQTVIVYTHWGDEYVKAPKRIKDIAKLFAKSGADLVVGSHPHVVLSSEKIQNTFVYYSLGNFIFDQYWNEKVSTGLVLEVNIKNTMVTIVGHQVVLNRDGRTCLVK